MTALSNEIFELRSELDRTSMLLKEKDANLQKIGETKVFVCEELTVSQAKIKSLQKDLDYKNEQMLKQENKELQLRNSLESLQSELSQKLIEVIILMKEAEYVCLMFVYSFKPRFKT